MPAKHGFGLHDHEVIFPVLEEAMDQHPERTIAVVELDLLGAALQDVELVAKDDVLHGQAVSIG